MPINSNRISRKVDANKKDMLEDYVVDINNKLVDICSTFELDLNINPIHPDRRIREKRKEHGFGDDEKRAIISAIESDERKDAIREQAMKAAGITKEDYDKLSGENVFQKLKNLSNAEAPPKTDWKKITVDASEKDKIIKSIKANQQSKHVFSKEFKWRPEEFLEAFSYLEEAKGYTGPFLTAVVDKKDDLERLSKNPKLNEGIYSMYLGKYVLLSVYDITAEAGVSAKKLYIGLEYLNMVGRLKFDSLTTVGTSAKIKDSQKLLVKEFLDAMDIIYEENHPDLS